MDNKEVIKEVDKFLKGIHMGGATFKGYLEKAKDNSLKNELVQIIESFKRHEEAITNRIEILGGDASDTLGIIGTMAEIFEKIKNLTIDNDKEVVEHAIKAMNMGIEQGEKFLKEHGRVNKELDGEMEAIVKDYYIHLNNLKKWQ